MTYSGDGLDQTLDRVEASLKEDLVPVEIFNDEVVFKAELERIFLKCWVFVAHESEIPNPGDFVQRRIGVDPVIVTRGGDGGINVLSNYCRHRATQVCQTDSGNSRFFKCPYHGWIYSGEGDLIGTPHMHDAYGERLDPKAWGLLRAPRVATRQGFIFASLAAEGQSLDEYLGGAGWMLDLIAGLHPDGMRVAGPPDRYKVKGNWKISAENFAGDVYHIGELHRSVEEVGLLPGAKQSCEFGRAYEFDNGHAFMGHTRTRLARPSFVPWGYPPDITAHFDLSGMDDAQLQVVNREPPTVGTIFPNLSFIRATGAPTPDSPQMVYTGFRQWQPIGPGEIELWSWQFVWNFMSEEQVRDSYLGGQFNFGSGGIFEQDDTVAWEGAPKAAASPWMRQEQLRLNYQQRTRATVDLSPDPDWTGPGIKRNSGYGESNQLAFYRNWLRLMRGDAAVIEGSDAG